METLITSGIEISVETDYRGTSSAGEKPEYLFAYHITIGNRNLHPVQLISRRWIITDMNGDVEFVEGAGVVGRQPILYANDSFDYASGCHLPTPFGKMEGVYIFENKLTGEDFEVTIPVFKLEAPELLN